MSYFVSIEILDVTKKYTNYRHFGEPESYIDDILITINNNGVTQTVEIDATAGINSRYYSLAEFLENPDSYLNAK